MPLLWFYLMFSVVSPASTCGPESLLALEPQTQKTHCLERWKPKTLVLVTEKDCGPCAELLERIRQSPRDAWQVELVWIEPDLSACLASSLRVASFARSWCASRDELERKWGVQSTPIVFWEQRKKQHIQRGSLGKKEVLPWNATP